MPMRGRRGCARGSGRFCPLAFLHHYRGGAYLPIHAYAYFTLSTWAILLQYIVCSMYIVFTSTVTGQGKKSLLSVSVSMY